MPRNAIDLYNEGYYYYTGSNGYPLNQRKAFEYFQRADEAGVSHAMNYIGIMYEKGQTVDQDQRLAVDWFYRAIQADSGNAHAAYNIGCHYYYGNGVEKDPVKAYNFLKATVDLGLGNKHTVFPQSCYLTGCILLEHFRDQKAAYPYFAEAAKYDKIPGAWHNLGWLSEQGVVPLKNPGSDPKISRAVMARGFYEEAAKLGYAPAMDAAARLCLYLNDNAKARMWLQKAIAQGYEPAKKRLKMLDVAEGNGSVWSLFAK